MAKMTVQEWLQLPKPELDIELAKVLTPGPRKHNLSHLPHCIKCKHDIVGFEADTPCPIPDPIDSDDWNVAMKWRDKVVGKPIDENARRIRNDYFYTLTDVVRTGQAIPPSTADLICYAQSKHYLIAAALAKEAG